jgi:hypothetical protein
VLIAPAGGWWTCRSCNTSGDAAGLVMALNGCTYREAARILTIAYGPPKNPRAPKRRVWTVEL